MDKLDFPGVVLPRTPSDVFVTQTFLLDNFDTFLYIPLWEKPCHLCLPCISTVWSYHA